MTGDFETDARAVLRRLTGDPEAEFHPGQLEAIEAIVTRRERVLVVQRTGWGKSAVYFIATRLLRDQGAGPTLLVSPLLALMRNQVEAAQHGGVRAAALNSANPHEWDEIMQALETDGLDLLLVSEMRLRNPEFRARYLPLLARGTGLVVVDEAHCISDWGHDFRPHYRRIVRFLDLLPSTVPVLGCTATANDRVVVDVQRQLGDHLTTIRGPLGRDGLSLHVLEMPDAASRLAWLARNVPHLPGTGIVYCLTVRDTEIVAEFLRRQGIEARAYSGGTEGEEREDIERALLDNSLKAVVATSALGMGFDKPDLAFVVHYQVPGSPIAYYQQVGRAGRQLPSSFGVALHGAEDERIQDWFINTAFPPREQAEAVIEVLANSDEPLSVPRIEAQVNVRRSRLDGLLAQLEVDGAIESVGGSRWVRTLAPWAYPQERIDGVTGFRRAEQQVMRDYVGATACRMEVLRRVLDDPEARPCGICDNCAGPHPWAGVETAQIAEAQAFLGRQHVVREPRRQWPAGTGGPTGRIPLDERPASITALCRWGDPVWGEMIRAGKEVDHVFDDALVEALAALARTLRLDPEPEWLTFVPSLRDPDLVAGLAQRLARALGLPLHPAVEKVRDTERQRAQENSAHQVRNLLGAFSVTAPVPPGPVLLLDDMVDSGWTITVVASALRQAGAGPVHALALADTQGS